MRVLTPAPLGALDPASGEPIVGSFRGAVPRIDLTPLARNPLARLARQKRWLYGAIATDALYLGFAVVDLGYASSAFAFAFERDGMHVAADASFAAPPFVGRVRQTRRLHYAARFDLRRGSIRMTRARG